MPIKNSPPGSGTGVMIVRISAELAEIREA
jgi:hypothetical protein